MGGILTPIDGYSSCSPRDYRRRRPGFSIRSEFSEFQPSLPGAMGVLIFIILHVIVRILLLRRKSVGIPKVDSPGVF